MEKPEARSQKEQRQWLTGRTATYVTDTAVNVSKFLQAEQPRAVGGVIEGKALHNTSRQHLSLLISSSSPHSQVSLLP